MSLGRDFSESFRLDVLDWISQLFERVNELEIKLGSKSGIVRGKNKKIKEI